MPHHSRTPIVLGSAISFIAALVPCAAGADYTWNGAGADALWSNPANWEGQLVPVPKASTRLYFIGYSKPLLSTNDLASPFGLNSIYLANRAGGKHLLDGKPIEFLADGLTLPTLSRPPDLTLRPAGASPIFQDPGIFDIKNDLILSADTTFSSASDDPINFFGALSGAGALTVTGGGPITLLAQNTYAGRTTIAGGYLEIGPAASLGQGSASIGPDRYRYPGRLILPDAAAIQSGDDSVTVNRGGFVVFKSLNQAALNRLTSDSRGIIAFDNTTQIAPTLNLSRLPDIRIGVNVTENFQAFTFSSIVIPGGDVYRFGGELRPSDSYRGYSTLRLASRLSDAPIDSFRSLDFGSSDDVTDGAGTLIVTNLTNSYSGGTIIHRGATLRFDYTTAPGQTPFGSGAVDIHGNLLLDGPAGALGALRNDIRFHPGSAIFLNNADPQGNNAFDVNRWPDDRPIDLNGTNLYRRALANHSVEVVGAVTYSDGSEIHTLVSPTLSTVSTTGVSAASFARGKHGTLEWFPTASLSNSSLTIHGRLQTRSTNGLIDPATGMVHPSFVGFFPDPNYPNNVHPNFLAVKADGSFVPYPAVRTFDPDSDSEVVRTPLPGPTDPVPFLTLDADETVWALSSNTLSLDLNGHTLTIRSGGLTLANEITGGVLDFSDHGAPVEAIINSGQSGVGFNSTIYSTISGSAGLTKFGSNRLTLAGPNAFSGGLSVNRGELVLDDPGALPPDNPIHVDYYATLDLHGQTVSTPSLTGAGTVMNNGPGDSILTVEASADHEFAGTLAAYSPLTFVKSGPASLTLSGRLYGGIPVAVNQGQLILSGSAGQPNPFNTAAGSTLRFDADYTVGPIDGEGTTSISRRVAVTSQRVRQHALIVADGATARIAPANTTESTSRLRELTLASTARVDLSDNALVLDDADLSQVHRLIARARNSSSGLWQGPGLTTSSATAITGLGVISNDRGDGTPVYTSFAGQDVDARAVLVKYSYNGDSNIDGTINGDDYFNIDNGFARGLPALYGNGDFNFDGKINIDDFFLIDLANVNQGAPLTTSFAAIAAAAVPEPAGCVLALGAIAFVLVGGRRNRSLRST